MRHPVRLILAAAAAAALAVVGPANLLAASVPEVSSVVVARDTRTDQPILTIVGTNLTKFTGFTLTTSQGAAVAGTVSTQMRAKAMLVVGLPPGLAGGTYDLTAAIGTSGSQVLHLVVDDGALFRGAYGTGAIPATGAGVRMMWYPGKAAFRAGSAAGTQWDDANVGSTSIALGASPTASGDDATALGYGTYATGSVATAMGYSTVASGASATASGYATTANGGSSTATGFGTVSSGFVSTAMGEATTAQAYGEVALGRFNVAAGTGSSVVAADPVLVVGNGTSNLATSNAFTLLRNGNLSIAGTLTQNSDARLKRDVAPLAGVLPRLRGIRAVSYRMRDEAAGPAGTQIGLLAQEVAAAFPELVREDSRGTLSVAYGNFSAVLLEAVQEQQATIEARDREVAALRRELAEVRAATEGRLARLEALAAK